MTAVEIREKLRKFFFPLKYVQLEALSEVIADNAGSDEKLIRIDVADEGHLISDEVLDNLKIGDRVVLNYPRYGTLGSIERLYDVSMSMETNANKMIVLASVFLDPRNGDPNLTILAYMKTGEIWVQHEIDIPLSQE